MAEITLFTAANTGASLRAQTVLSTDENSTDLLIQNLPDGSNSITAHTTFTLPMWTFDATISEHHIHTAEATMHPVERGVDITDHIQVKPFALTLEGIVSNTPLIPGIESRTTRIRELYDDLVSLFEDKRLLYVVTGLKRYSNMVITNVSVPRDSPNRQHIVPSVELVQINTVEQSFVALESLGIPKRAKPKDNKDAETTAATEEQKKRPWNPWLESWWKAQKDGRELNTLENLAAGNVIKALFTSVPDGFDPSAPFVTSPSAF